MNVNHMREILFVAEQKDLFFSFVLSLLLLLLVYWKIACACPVSIETTLQLDIEEYHVVGIFRQNFSLHNPRKKSNQMSCIEM